MLNRIFYPALTRAGIPQNFRLHDLRGTYATLALVATGDVKAVQEQLGHKSARVTLEIYAKVNEESRRMAANKLESYLVSGKVH